MKPDGGRTVTRSLRNHIIDSRDHGPARPIRQRIIKADPDRG